MWRIPAIEPGAPARGGSLPTSEPPSTSEPTLSPDRPNPPTPPPPPSAASARPPLSTGGTTAASGGRFPSGATVPPSLPPPCDREEWLRPDGLLNGRYRIERQLGQGGMGVVFLATDHVLEKEVALKLVQLEDGGIESLRNEVRLAQRVTHPNVCRIYDLDRIDGLWTIKMEYVPGETLERRIAHPPPLAIEEAVRIAREVGEGLAAAHARRVVHRDLKPANVMLEQGTGRAVLMDFGIARSMLLRPRDAGIEPLVGTPAYMAPEQFEGRDVDARADLYALGCMLHEMLVGRVPFGSDDFDACRRMHLELPVPDLRAARPEVPAWLAHLVRQLLEKDPARRPQSARAVLGALAGPRRRIGFAVVTATLATLATATGAAALHTRAHDTWRPAIRVLPSVYNENADTPAFSPDGRWIAYTSDRAGGWRLLIEPLGGDEARSLTPIGASPIAPRWSRDGRWLYYMEATGGSWRVSIGDGRIERVHARGGAVDDCGGGRLALVELDAPGCPDCQRIVVRRGDVTREVARGPAGARLLGLQCDRAGQQLTWAMYSKGKESFSGAASVWVAPIDGGPARALTHDQHSNLYPTFAADGRSVIFSSTREDRTNLYEVAVTGGPVHQLTSGEGPDRAPTISPDGKLLLYDLDITALSLFALGPGAGRRTLTSRMEDVSSPSVSPDGKEVIAAFRRRGASRIVAITVATGEERALGPGELPAFSVDGREVVMVLRDGGRPRLFAMPRTGGPPRLLAPLPGEPARIACGWDDAVHLEVEVAGQLGAYRVPLAGGPAVPEGPSPWRLIVPLADGWRAAIRARGEGLSEAHLLPPGAALDSAAAVVVHSLAGWTPDGRVLVYLNGTELRRRVIASGAEERLGELDFVMNLAPTPDGRTVIYTSEVGHVRRQLITNFAGRPQPPLAPQ
jgi:hypothetical protein